MKKVLIAVALLAGAAFSEVYTNTTYGIQYTTPIGWRIDHIDTSAYSITIFPYYVGLHPNTLALQASFTGTTSSQFAFQMLSGFYPIISKNTSTSPYLGSAIDTMMNGDQYSAFILSHAENNIALEYIIVVRNTRMIIYMLITSIADYAQNRVEYGRNFVGFLFKNNTTPLSKSSDQKRYTDVLKWHRDLLGRMNPPASKNGSARILSPLFQGR